MISLRNLSFFAVSILSALTLTCCAPAPTDPDDLVEYQHNHDPAEPTNRKIFAFNMMADHYVLQPVARAYSNDLPPSVQQGVHNFVGNLHDPQIAVNDAMQGNMKRSGKTALRFIVNSTVGLAGIFDVATDWKLTHHEADFGQTFGVWGIGSGPFVELPLLGSSNVRDGVGTAIEMITNPFGSFVSRAPLTIVGYVGGGLGAIDGRAEVLPMSDKLEKDSLDYYATLRSIAWQRRAKLIEDGKNPDPKKDNEINSEPKSPEPIVPLFRNTPYL